MLKILNMVAYAGLVFSGFMMLRNEWVYRVRMKRIQEEYQRNQSLISEGRYDEIGDYLSTLPSYDSMMWRFWVWDVKRFHRR